MLSTFLPVEGESKIIQEDYERIIQSLVNVLITYLTNINPLSGKKITIINLIFILF